MFDEWTTMSRKLICLSLWGSASRMVNFHFPSLLLTGRYVKKPGTLIVVSGVARPSLTAAGVKNALQDPILELHDANGLGILSNDNWRETQATEIAATGLAPIDDRESALTGTIPPGNYSAVVRGKNDTTGVGLVEVYNVQ